MRSPGGISESELESLSDVARIALTVIFARVAALALQVYEYTITFDNEVKYIWSGPWNHTKTLYLLNRYIPFIGISGLIHVLAFTPHSQSSSCVPRWTVSSSFILLNYLVLKFTLYFRAYALWGFQRRTRAVLNAIYLVLAGGVVYVIAMFFISAKSLAGVFKIHVLGRGCVIFLTYQFDWIAFIILMTIETVSVVMVFLRALRFTDSPIMKITYSDGVVYYVLIMASSMANTLLILITSPSPIRNLLLAPQSVFQSILCNRLLIHILMTAMAPSETTSIFKSIPPRKAVPSDLLNTTV